jgi:hypothetical protein
MSRHTDLIDAVNDAKTQHEHDYARAFLEGWRAGQADAGLRWSLLEADRHSMARFGEDRPMCCGELLDWTPVVAVTE